MCDRSTALCNSSISNPRCKHGTQTLYPTPTLSAFTSTCHTRQQFKSEIRTSTKVYAPSNLFVCLPRPHPCHEGRLLPILRNLTSVTFIAANLSTIFLIRINPYTGGKFFNNKAEKPVKHRFGRRASSLPIEN